MTLRFPSRFQCSCGYLVTYVIHCRKGMMKDCREDRSFRSGLFFIFMFISNAYTYVYGRRLATNKCSRFMSLTIFYSSFHSLTPSLFLMHTSSYSLIAKHSWLIHARIHTVAAVCVNLLFLLHLYHNIQPFHINSHQSTQYFINS